MPGWECHETPHRATHAPREPKHRTACTAHTTRTAPTHHTA